MQWRNCRHRSIAAQARKLPTVSVAPKGRDRRSGALSIPGAITSIFQRAAFLAAKNIGSPAFVWRSSKSLIPKRPLIEVKSMKVVGASGLAFYFPGGDNLAAGLGVTAFKIAPQKRATQIVFGLRFRF
jgi:hypothetical protein